MALFADLFGPGCKWPMSHPGGGRKEPHPPFYRPEVRSQHFACGLFGSSPSSSVALFPPGDAPSAVRSGVRTRRFARGTEMKEAACYMLCQLAGKEANGANVRLPPPAAGRSEVLGLSSLLACSGSRRLELPGTGRRCTREGARASQRKQNAARVAIAALLRAFCESAAERSPKLLRLQQLRLPVLNLHAPAGSWHSRPPCPRARADEGHREGGGR